MQILRDHLQRTDVPQTSAEALAFSTLAEPFVNANCGAQTAAMQCDVAKA